MVELVWYLWEKFVCAKSWLWLVLLARELLPLPSLTLLSWLDSFLCCGWAFPCCKFGLRWDSKPDLFRFVFLVQNCAFVSKVMSRMLVETSVWNIRRESICVGGAGIWSCVERSGGKWELNVPSRLDSFYVSSWFEATDVFSDCMTVVT